MLPPGVSASGFALALAAFREAVGGDQVYTSDEDVALYQDAYDVLWGLPGQRHVSAAVAPATVEQVQKVVVAAWLVTQAHAADAALIEKGKAAFACHCAACHGTQVVSGNQHLPGTEALAIKYQGKEPGALEERTDLSPELVKTFVRTGVSVMPFFRKTMVTDAELDAIAAYLSRNYRPVDNAK